MFDKIFIGKFIKAYIKSMRLYYSFITGIAGLVGISYYHFLIYSIEGPNQALLPISAPKAIIIMVILFLSWGINQIFNDYLGLQEDRINAPERPMVTGDLDPLIAILVSSILMLIAFVVTLIYLEIIAVFALILGVGLNIIYEYAKGYGIWGNIIFGIMISCCMMFSFLASGDNLDLFLTDSNLSLLFLVALINGIMTYYTYFKDFQGDKAVGKRTLIVMLGLEKAGKLSLVISFLPLFSFMVMYFGMQIWDFELNNIFVLLGLIATALQIWTGFLFFRNPTGDSTYFALSMNFRACSCTESALISIFNPALGVLLFLTSYFFIGFLFNFHSNTRG